jgi:acyl carrier protein
MYDKIVEIIADQLGIDSSVIDGSSKVMEDLGADSLDVVEMLMTMEETFDITVPDEDIERLLTVNDVVAYVSESAN